MTHFMVQSLQDRRERRGSQFGGVRGLGGFSREALDAWNTVITFFYMGAREFEEGCVPCTLNAISADLDQYREMRFYLPDRIGDEAIRWQVFREGVKPETPFVVHVLCKPDQAGLVEELLNEVWKKDLYHRTLFKETYTNPAFQTVDDGFVGWLECEHNFLFFRDEAVFRRVVAFLREHAGESFLPPGAQCVEE